MDVNSTLGIAQTAATLITGSAVAYFAYVTYQMSNQMTEVFPGS